MIHALLTSVADISVSPDFSGLPDSVRTGLIHLTNNAAAALLLLSGLGIVISLCGMVVGSWLQSQQLSERSRSGLLVSAGAGALLFVAVAVANYTMRLFR
jgi:hypothetical protein